MKSYKTDKECYKFYKENSKSKIILRGISEDVFEALKELYVNVNFHEVSDGATRKNNKLLFGEDDITFLNYEHKCFKSTELNPCFNRQAINIVIKFSKITINDNIYSSCIDLKLISHVSKRSKVTGRYKILINKINYRHIERFLRVYEMSNQFSE